MHNPAPKPNSSRPTFDVLRLVALRQVELEIRACKRWCTPVLPCRDCIARWHFLEANTGKRAPWRSN